MRRKKKNTHNHSYVLRSSPVIDAGVAGNDMICPRDQVVVYGIHSVFHCIKNRKCSELFVTESSLREMSNLDLSSIKVNLVKRVEIDRMLGADVVHQGCVVFASPIVTEDISDLLSIITKHDNSLVLVLDQLTDPHNLGAIVRSSAAFGVDAIIISDRNSPDINNSILVKTACGGAEYVKFSFVTNIKKTLDMLKKSGYWSFAMDERGDNYISGIGMSKYSHLAIVMGAEGKGIRRLVKESCDGLVRLETNPDFPTLNVSNATAIALHQVKTC